MKILFIVSYIPLSKALGPQGPKNLTTQILKYLVDKFQIDLVVLSNDEVSYHDEINKSFIKLNSYKHIHIENNLKVNINRLESFFKLIPLTIGNYKSKELTNYIEKNINLYDIVHFDYYLLAANFFITQNKIPTVLYSHDAYSLYYHYALKDADNIFDKLKLRIKKYFFQNLERKYFNKVNRVLTVSPVDSSFLTSNGVKNVNTLPIPINNNNNNLSKKDNKCTVLLVCPYVSVSDKKLTDNFIKEYLDKLILSININKIIFFSHKSYDIKINFSNEKIEFINFVNDYESFLNQDLIYVYLRYVGSGLHTKLQDAMQFKLPIVAFSNLLLSLGGSNKEEYYACNDLKEMYNYIILLSNDRKERDRIGNNALTFARKNFDLKSIGDQLVKIYNNTIEDFNNNEINRR